MIRYFIAAFAFFFASLNAKDVRTVKQSNISGDYSKKIAAHAVEKAEALGYNVCISISDASGRPVYFERMDGAQLSSIEHAVSKSYTSAIFQESTSEFSKDSKTGKKSEPMMGIEKVTSVSGGVPIMEGGECIGGIGISGCFDPDEDDQIAVYALSKAGMTDITTEDDKKFFAREAARIWLMTLDSEDYQQMWEDAAPSAKNVISSEEWGNAVKTARQPFGALKKREFLGADYNSDVPGAPSGEFVTVRFKSRFSDKKGIETITTALENGVWSVTGYYLKPDLTN